MSFIPPLPMIAGLRSLRLPAGRSIAFETIHQTMSRSHRPFSVQSVSIPYPKHNFGLRISARPYTTRSLPFFIPSFDSRILVGRKTFFSPSHRYSTASPISTVVPTTDSFTTSPKPSTKNDTVIPRSLPIWLLGCSALVFGIIVIGGLTRLTESGLSITEWQPLTGILPPLTKEEWDIEWDKYKVSPEGIMTNSKIEMDEFKKIFYMEWAHRIAGRTLGLAFVLPAVYYLYRYRLPGLLRVKLLAIGLGIGFQGVLGWYMVQSGLEQEIIDTNSVPRVSQYRLAAHLSAALALYIGMVYTALGLRRDVKFSSALTQNASSRQSMLTYIESLNHPVARRYKNVVNITGLMVFLTAVSGAFVAGLDAGLVYNEFPTMGGNIVPPIEELMDKRYAKRSDGGDNWWRNMLENPVTAQVVHRLSATTTFASLLSLPFFARAKLLRPILPKSTKRWAYVTAAAAIAQVTMGITTLLYLVPIPLAAMHQAGSVVLLTCILGLSASLRRPGKAITELQRGLRTRR